MRCTASNKAGVRCGGLTWNKTPGNLFCHHHTPQEAKDKRNERLSLEADVREARTWLGEYEIKLTAARKEVSYYRRKRDEMKRKLVRLTDL
jgi:uncharacterized coiled-coil DUF342 family protein